MKHKRRKATLPLTYVGSCRGGDTWADVKLTLCEEHEDGVYEHTNVELRLTVRGDDPGVPVRWKVRWFHTLSYLQATLPEYLRAHCPYPELAEETLRRLVHPEHGLFFPS